MGKDNDIGPGEEILVDRDEVLWRNAHPDWIQDGKLTSQVFRPTPKDDKKLSTAREYVVSAEDHFMEFTENCGLASAGVWALSVGEVEDERLRAIYDENAPSAPDPRLKGHTSLDFTSVSKNQAKRIGGRLRDRAEDRGLQHPR